MTELPPPPSGDTPPEPPRPRTGRDVRRGRALVRARRHRRWVLATGVLGAAVVLSCYLAAFPGLSTGAPLLVVLPVRLALWLSLLVVGLYAVAATLRARAWWWAAVVPVLLIAGAASPVAVPWADVWVDSQVALHRDGLADLARRAGAGEDLDGAELPGTLALLDTDGRVQEECGVATSAGPACVLFLQVWHDFLGGNGTGIVWFPADPTASSVVTTAPEDGRRPARSLGRGWWWVD